ncbi:uncharacterized protein C8Q71DRAFT_852053 [Rhodofomes roseus]|uniref:Protein kinase domain-containing protein n=1 Tax=Rhodofomes roseus TaxID=34475 RepID=A0ABQ8KY46_9APHY|nr:uncharacterized protein C8Q71DRAFT_852053 [Rhodofomes roseus]KAH9843515.1 hypothetical protein C8Q71DRAFT_852053 [Rhodofomes roseus]
MSEDKAQYLTPTYSLGGAGNFAAHSSSNHALLKEELLGRVKYDDPTVFKRLRIQDEDATNIERCHQFYQDKQDHNLQRLLEVTGKIDPRGEKRKREVEQKMYEPLQQIFNFLANFDGRAGVRRDFIESAQAPHAWAPPTAAKDAFTPGFPRFRPDFDLVDKGSSAHHWDRCVGFVEVKADREDGNPPQDMNKTVKEVVMQCADYARIHLACRQFWVFSVVLIITAMDFRVAIVDHTGVLLSPRHSIIDDRGDGAGGQRDARMFVRVVRALSRSLSERELGQDPSVTPLSQKELEELAHSSSIPGELRRVIMPGNDDYYPSYIVPFHGPDNRTWCTVGPPIWVSLSLFGRGTTVWRVVELVTSNTKRGFSGEMRVLKSSWRDQRRSPEADLYRVISTYDDCPPGVPELLCGGDVLYGDRQPLKLLTTAQLRGDQESSESKVLHRLVLSIVGEGLWKYTDELQLLRAFRAVVEVHEYLCSKGIIHGDISAGNLLLWPGPSAKAAGFLSDFDLAHFDESVLPHAQEKPVDIASEVKHASVTENTRGHIPVTGTLQFMALELLGSAFSKKAIEHTAAHDLEAISYVLGYTVLRQLTSGQGCPGPLGEYFKKVFGAMSLLDIMEWRGSGSPLKWAVSNSWDEEVEAFLSQHVSGPVAHVMHHMSQVNQNAHLRIENATARRRYESDDDSDTEASEEKDCTHSHYLKILNKGIRRLEKSPASVKTFSPVLQTPYLAKSHSSGNPKKKQKKAV